MVLLVNMNVQGLVQLGGKHKDTPAAFLKADVPLGPAGIVALGQGANEIGRLCRVADQVPAPWLVIPEPEGRISADPEIDPVSAAAFELMHDGDTAMVATQYSFLPSWISFLVDLDKAAANGRALVDAVTAHWRQLPADARPELFVFGESLGSYGSENAFASVNAKLSLEAATADATGVLWSGPTFANPIWHQVLRQRVDSPVWHPRLGFASPLRVLGRPDSADVVSGPTSQGHHVTYLSHPSDPVTWASVDALWSKPPWMERPTGYDVPAHPFWFPVVTFVQELFDLMAGFSAPPGHGHNYNPDQADGWASISAPPGWTAADTIRLDERIQTWAE
jgi:uncharacterized membrane protein